MTVGACDEGVTETHSHESGILRQLSRVSLKLPKTMSRS